MPEFQIDSEAQIETGRPVVAAPSTAGSCEFKRLRPALGTFVEIRMNRTKSDNQTTADRLENSDIFDFAFSEIGRLEKVFNFFDPMSALSRVNLDPNCAVEHVELDRLLGFARELEKKSDGAFQIDRHGKIDLGGIAKGFICDLVVSSLESHLEFFSEPGISGTVNAGGDLRFFGRLPTSALVRVGRPSAPLVRELPLRGFRAIATSSPDWAQTLNSFSSTVYHAGASTRTRARGHTATVLAQNAWQADGMTKVVLFGRRDIIELCCRDYACVAYIFDEKGDPVEYYGDR